ncbi:MAG: hypothetical protein DHS20C17_11690 [Cyclobacteriaceae bacterium]|nr:MAG: hypothetical protein DHS20C17_11690 [Cyclobacteriaceae bacterium]
MLARPLKGQQYNFRSYSLEDGLPQSEVRALIQDSIGNIWLGTNGGGLCRFNGKEFQVFTKKSGLPDNLIGALHQDKFGNLWIASSSGLTKYDGKEFKSYLADKGINDGHYMWLDSDDQGKVWAFGFENQGGVRKILYLEEDRFHDLVGEYPELSENNYILWVYKDKLQHFHFITKNGLYTLNGRKLERSPLQDLAPSDQIAIPFLDDSKGNLWFAAGKFPTPNKLYKSHAGKITQVELPAGISPKQFNFAIEDSKGQIWISLFGTGVLKIIFDEQETPSFQVFNRSNGLPNTRINQILEDREGNIWFGSNGGGLIKYSSDKFIAISLEDGLSNEIIWSVSQDGRGDFWFGTGGGAIIKYDGKEVENVFTEENSPIGFVRKFLELGNGVMLIGSMNGLWSYDGKEFSRVSQQYGLPERAKIGDLIKDGNELLISVYGKGVARYNGRETKFITAEKDGISTNDVDHLMKDSKGNIWMTSKRRGATKYQGDPLNALEPKEQDAGSRVVNFDSKNGLNNDYIIQIAEDKTGNLWFASYGGGLNIYDGSQFTYLDMESGLTSDNIYSVIADNEGNIWAGTQNGVDKIIIDDQGVVLSITNFDKYDGFTGIESNSMANFKDDEGNLWFGTINGVMRYNPTADQVNPTPPVTNITQMKLFFKNVDWNESSYQKYISGIDSWHQLPKDLNLPYDLNHVTFNFEALSFQVPEKVKYQWRLEGLDKDWAPVTSKTEAVYANLAPGNYTFQVKASNNDGVWNQVPASFPFRVQPPWWGTWWFRILLVTSIIGLVVVFYKWRIHNIKQKKNELEKMVKLKTQEVVKQKDEILVQSKKLEESYNNLELLSDVGKSITANLSVSNIIDTVYENVNNLMKAEVFWIGIYDEEKRSLEFQGGVEAGAKLPNFCCTLAEDDRLAVWCFKNQREVFINDYSKEYQKYADRQLDAIAGEPTQSIIYVPLISQGEPFGVLSVQSYEKNAYDEHHLSLIRNIAVHTKIALENASAYEKITEQSRDLLIQKEQIEHNNQELLELNKEKNHLIGIVAHDLRNPLTSALTIGGLLKTGEALSEEQHEYTEHILNAMERMNAMVNRILDIKAIESKSIEMDLQATNLVEVMCEVHENFKDALENKQLEFEFCQDCPKHLAVVDRNYLTQIYENLVSNAIKFSPPQRKIYVGFQQSNGHIVTEIRDQGPGLTAGDMQRLFQKYQKLSAQPTAGEQSTGLGLSIVKKYVEAMDGKVWAESFNGEGAVFKVQFRINN